MTRTASCSSYRTSGLEDVWMSLVFVLNISWLFLCHQSEPVSQCGAAAGGLHVPVYSSPRSGGVCDPHVSPDRDRHHAQSPAAGTHTLPHTVHKHTHVYYSWGVCVCVAGLFGWEYPVEFGRSADHAAERPIRPTVTREGHAGQSDEAGEFDAPPSSWSHRVQQLGYRNKNPINFLHRGTTHKPLKTDLLWATRLLIIQQPALFQLLLKIIITFGKKNMHRNSN